MLLLLGFGSDNHIFRNKETIMRYGKTAQKQQKTASSTTHPKTFQRWKHFLVTTYYKIFKLLLLFSKLMSYYFKSLNGGNSFNCQKKSYYHNLHQTEMLHPTVQVKHFIMCH